MGKLADAIVPSVSEDLDTPQLLRLYRQMVLLRRFERTVQALYKAGEVPGFIHLYIGEEATAVGVMAHLRPDDWITSTHRGHGHALAKGLPPKILMAELFGKATGTSGGRGGTMHLYAPGVGLFGTNGIVGGGLPAAVGLGLSAQIRGTDQVAVAFFGDGATSLGAFHESINLAAAQNAPLVFVCENNLYATATPLSMATRNTNIASRAAAYGIPGVSVDGNDVLAVWQAAGEAIQRARSGKGPTLVESRTYRIVGHHEGDPPIGTYRTREEVEAWSKRCPLLRFGQFLLESGRATGQQLKALEAEADSEVEAAVEFARTSPQPDPATATLHVFADPIHPPLPDVPRDGRPNKPVVQGWLEAVRDAIAEEMRRDPHLIYLGEGTGERGGTFAHTKGLYEEFGARRMIDTPICELGFTGASIGTSASGCRTIADLMFSDFLWEAGGQLAMQAARLRYMSNNQISVPMVVRAAIGTIKNAGPHHSGTYHPVWAHCPGLIVVLPSNPADAKGLMKTALRASDPVIFLEPKSLFSTKGPVPQGEHFVPFGVANVVREGTDLSIVSCGLWLHRSLEAADQLATEGVSCEVIDLRTIVPLDVETIVASATKTRRLLVVDEGFAMCGIGAEIAAVIMEHAFEELNAPVGRLHMEPVPTPFSPPLENAVVADAEKIARAARAVLDGRPIVQRRAAAAVKSQIEPLSHSRREVGGEGSAAPSTARTSTTDGVPFLMPNMDLTITEATVVAWRKQVGDTVQAGEPVVEVETDKAVTEVESPVAGTLVEIVAPQGTVVRLGGRLGTIRPAEAGRICRAVLLVLAAISAVSAEEKAPAAGAMTPIDLRQITIAGEIGRRVDITAYKNLLAINTERDFLAPFRDRNKPAGYIGLGKLIDATVRFAAYTNDEKVRALKNHLITEAIKTQDPDGYIGILVPASRIWGVYDIHEMSYLVLGLANDHKYFGQQASLRAAQKLADYIITRWSAEPHRIPGPNGKRDKMYGVTTGLDGALLTLYEQTKDRRYLDFCVSFEHCKLPQWNVRIKLDGRRMDDERHSYVYMALCVAQLQLYNFEPDPRLLSQAQQAIDFLTRQDGLLITGSCSRSEGWHNIQIGSGPASESCATAYLTRMLGRLLQITGDAKYGDMMERTVYNALFAAQSPDGRRIRYFCPFEGERTYYSRDTFCCPNNFRRIIAELPTMVYYRSGGGLAVNLYTPSTAKVELGGGLRLTVRQETGYPSLGRVLIHLDPSRTADFPLRLRIPRWCTKPVRVAVNGQAIGTAIPRGSLLTIERPWRAGDRIELDMPMSWRWIKGRKAQAGRFALMRGPLLFCLSPGINRLPKDLDVRKIVIDPKTVGEPSEDQRVRPAGLACKVRAWSPGRATTQPSDLELLLTEFPDPSGTATYHLLSDPSMSQDDELLEHPFSLLCEGSPP